LKILVVMSQYPFPPLIGSEIVAYNSIKHLSKKNTVELICLKPRNADINLPEFATNVELVDQKVYTKLTRNLFLIANIFSINSFWSNYMKVRVEKKIQSGDYDAIVLFEIDALQYCPPTCYSKLTINIEDPLSIKFKRMLKLSVWTLRQKFKLTLLSKLAESYEKKVLPNVSKVLLLSLADASDMKKNGAYKNIGFMPYGIELQQLKPNFGLEKREKAIVFSGNMYHPPNVDGVLFFLREIYPSIISVNPNVVFWIVGSNPDKRIYKSAAKFKENVLITGKVESVAEYIKKAAVSICPIRLKIGVQTKVLEAMSMGTPVVSTSAGNSGVGGVSGIHLWIEDEPSIFANRVLDLLEGNDWENFSSQGLSLARDKFSWETSVAKLEDYIQTSKLIN